MTAVEKGVKWAVWSAGMSVAEKVGRKAALMAEVLVDMRAAETVVVEADL